MRVTKKTTFAFDFDNTISRDPEIFLKVMGFLRNRGHDVIVVSGRRTDVHPDDLDFLLDAGYKVVYTRHIAKRKWMEEVEKIKVDVWVDDCPESVDTSWFGEPRTFRDME